MRLKPYLYWAILLVALFLGFNLIAQVTNSVPELKAMAPNMAFGQFSAWQLIIPIVVPTLLGLFKMLIADIPAKWLPILAPIIGIALDQLLQLLGLYSANPLIAIALGSAGVGIREIKDQLGKAHLSALFLLLGLSFFAGCAQFVTTQKDISYEAKTGQKTREIITQAKARTLLDAKSELAKFKASQTDKTQSASVGSLSQESGATNLTSLVEAVVRGAVQGAK